MLAIAMAALATVVAFVVLVLRAGAAELGLVGAPARPDCAQKAAEGAPA